MNNKAAPKNAKTHPKKQQSNVTGLIVAIGRRDFRYDDVRSATLHAPLVDIPIDQLTIFRDTMKETQPDLNTNAIDDGVIRIVRVRPELYEVISGRNQIVAAIFDYKKAVAAAAEVPANQGKKVGELVKTPTLKMRLASWKHLNPCEHLGHKLDADQLKENLTQLAATSSVKINLPKEKTVPVAALFQKPAPKAPVPSSGKFGRIFGQAA